MKTSMHLLTVAGVLYAGVLALSAADKKHLGGPKGGRLLEMSGLRAEFLVEKDRSVTVTFYDAALKPVRIAGPSATVIAEAPGGKTRLELKPKNDVLVSQASLPDGEGYNLVVQLRSAAGARPQNFRFKLETHICQGCKRAEYACICDE